MTGSATPHGAASCERKAGAKGMRSKANGEPLTQTLSPAIDPARRWQETRYLVASEPRIIKPVCALADLIRPGDVLVLNDASTLPGSLQGSDSRGNFIEVRLAGVADPSSNKVFPQLWNAVLLGAGSWRDDTDSRPAPPSLFVGDELRFGGLAARVENHHSLSERFVTLRFDREGDELAQALFRTARPIQYSHLHHDLRVADVQTTYGGPAWAVEMASTGRPMRHAVLERLKAAGADVAWLTHAAGLSATGDEGVDRALPLPERYLIPQETVDRVRQAQRVIAVGTTVVRALESSASGGGGELQAGHGVATTRLGPESRLNVVDAILTGMHSPGESHWELLRAFTSDAVLLAAHAAAAQAGLLAHEFGDLLFVERQSGGERRVSDEDAQRRDASDPKSLGPNRRRT